MARSDYHVFGLGMGSDDLHYVGWTRRSLNEEQEKIFSDLVIGSARDVANWVAQAVSCGKISIFEIESAPSIEEARNCAVSLCRYFQSLGLDVVTATADGALVQVAKRNMPVNHAEGLERRHTYSDEHRMTA